MNCKDCIHYDICIFHADGNKTDKCRNYKSKSDVVEVVRCKDCKYWQKRSKGTHGACLRDGNVDYVFWTYDNDFCSYGERKEGD